MAPTAASVVTVALTLAACACTSRSPSAAPATTVSSGQPTARAAAVQSGARRERCSTPRVRYTPYPGHGIGLSRIPWVRAEPRRVGLVALLWYWPRTWTASRVRDARIFTGGVAPAGANVKVMWTFLAPAVRGRYAPGLIVRGRRLDAPGAFTQGPFAQIGYAGQRGAPSYASIIDVPRTGCWRLRLAAGTLRARVDLLAVPSRS